MRKSLYGGVLKDYKQRFCKQVAMAENVRGDAAAFTFASSIWCFLSPSRLFLICSSRLFGSSAACA